MSVWIWIIILLVVFGGAWYSVRRRRLNRSR
jgi:hypothetical protein